jgi:predicted flap endonuclease-1-like 5' DNA nuclease
MFHIFLIICNPLDLSCFWFWFLLSLLAFLLGWLLHWLFTGGLRARIDELTRERDNYHNAATKWESDYNSLKYKFEEQQKDNNNLRNRLAGCEADKATLQARLNAAKAESGTDLDTDLGADTETRGFADAGLMAGAGAATRGGGEGGSYAGLFKENNLQIIEGIGPKVEEVLKNAGIGTWGALAGTSVDRLQQIMTDAGSRFRLIVPESWPYQAKLADDGEWAKLIQYQKFTDTGVEGRGDTENDSKFEKLALKALGFSSMNPNDLKVVEGIGPKIEKLLKADGIKTWSELAATEVTRLQNILSAAGDRFRLADPTTWPEQAQLAADGAWEDLKSLQDKLNRGRK